MWLTTTEDPDHIGLEASVEFNSSSTTGGSEETSSSPSSVVSFAVQLSLLALCSAGGALANGLVFAVFYRRPSLRTISNRFVLSLILANLTSAVVIIPGHIYQLVVLHQSRPAALQQDGEVGVILEDFPPWPCCEDVTSWCWDKEGLDGLTILVFLASVLSILLISLDRYFAVNSPLHYSIIVTRQRSMAMISVVWLVSAILSVPVWAGTVLFQPQERLSSSSSSSTVTTPVPSRVTGNGTTGLLTEALAEEEESGYGYWMNLCYSVVLIMFGFAWPLCGLCWLYLRMYEAALKNSARTRRQSLCSNPVAAAAAAASTTLGVIQQQPNATSGTEASDDQQQSNSSSNNNGSCPPHQPSLTEALSTVASAAAAAAAASATESQLRLLAAAAAAVSEASGNVDDPSGPSRHHPGNREGWWRRAHRRSGGGGSFQRQVLALLWREEGRALRTTAMVISSFTCCWLPFFVWLLPFQLQHSQSEPSTSSSSVGVFLARLAAFSNVLISPAIYVYRNQVAQKEAGRVIQQLVHCRWAGSGSGTTFRFGPDGQHDPMMGIAAPLVLGGAGLTHHTNHHQLVHRTSSSLSNRSSSGGGASSLLPASSTLAVNCGGYSRRSSNSLLIGPNYPSTGNVTAGTDTSLALPVRHLDASDHQAALKSTDDQLRRPSVVVSLADGDGEPPMMNARASVSGGSSLLAATASPTSEGAGRPGLNCPSHGAQRQRSLTISTSLASSSRSPSPLMGNRPPPSPSRTRPPAKTPPTIYQSESVLQVILPVTYPSLDFFDTGLEDFYYARQHYQPEQQRPSSSSFSRFIQEHLGQGQQQAAGTATTGARPRRSRTYSLTRILSGGSRRGSSTSHRWPSVFKPPDGRSKTGASVVTAV